MAQEQKFDIKFQEAIEKLHPWETLIRSTFQTTLLITSTQAENHSQLRLSAEVDVLIMMVDSDFLARRCDTQTVIDANPVRNQIGITKVLLEFH